MIPTYFVIVLVLVLVVAGAILGPVLARRRRRGELQDAFGAEYGRAVETAGTKRNADKELVERERHIETLDLRPLSADERQRYQAEWNAAQSNFVDHPGVATRDADRLITEVMQLRNYPSSDFEGRAADISVQYPSLVSNYRAAGATAVKNGKQNVDTEELRKSMIYYRAVFDELLKEESAVPEQA